MFKLSGVEIMKNNRIELIEGVRHQLKDILESSKQAIYVYLDDTHKLCNQRFATLLGYGSTREWKNIGMSFPEAFVANQSRETLVSAYQNAMKDKIGSTIGIIWKKKGGGQVNTNVILVPVSFGDELLALHFITEEVDRLVWSE
jgi:PAS domain-containing protein